jgi:hypothetical protein
VEIGLFANLLRAKISKFDRKRMAPPIGKGGGREGSSIQEIGMVKSGNLRSLQTYLLDSM